MTESRARLLFTCVAICAIAVGVFARVHDLTTKTFFADEAFSALRITGHTEAAYRRLVDDRPHPEAAVAAFQEADSGTSVLSTLRSIGTEEPQRGPLYYSLAALWLRIAGTSVAGFRSLAALVGILTIGAAYAFGRVFFRSAEGGAVLAVLVAVSPFHIRYAQEAREYGLLSLVIFASAAAFVRASRAGGAWNWVLFAAACAVGMLTSPFFALVLLSYGLYVSFVAWRGQRREAVVPFTVAAVAALVATSPWYAYVTRAATRVSGETEWGANAYPLKFYLAKVVFNIGAVFFDYEFADLRFVMVLVVLLPTLAFFVFRGARSLPDAAVLALALVLPTTIVFVGNDLRMGAHFGTIARYVTPVWIALELLVAAGIYAGLQAVRRLDAFATPAAVFVAIVGAFCAFADAPYQTWYDNNDNEPTQQVAAAANARAHPIVLDAKLPLALSLVHYLRPNVRLQLYSEDDLPHLDRSGDPNMLFVPNERIRTTLGRTHVLQQTIAHTEQTVVGTFHVALARARSDASVSIEEFSAENALWLVKQ